MRINNDGTYERERKGIKRERKEGDGDDDDESNSDDDDDDSAGPPPAKKASTDLFLYDVYCDKSH